MTDKTVYRPQFIWTFSLSRFTLALISVGHLQYLCSSDVVLGILHVDNFCPNDPNVHRGSFVSFLAWPPTLDIRPSI